MQTVEWLHGNYKIIQDDLLYRFTSDSVLLSRFVKAKKGERVADFCAGSGIVGLHFYALNPKVESVTLFEMEKSLAEMSKKSVELNGLEAVFRIENVRLQEIPKEYTEAFSLILCNPPYENAGFEKSDPNLTAAHKELSLTLEELIVAAKRCLKFKGRFVLVHRADRAAEVITALSNAGLEPKKMQFVAGTAAKKPYAVLISAVKGGKKGIDVLPIAVNREGV